MAESLTLQGLLQAFPVLQTWMPPAMKRCRLTEILILQGRRQASPEILTGILANHRELPHG